MIQNSNKLKEGFLETAQAVALTMGAEGKLAVMKEPVLGMPIVTKDGISVAKKIFFEDEAMNMGAFLAKQAAAKTAAVSADTTTGTLVFASSLVKNCEKFNKKVERGIDIAHEEFNSLLREYSKPVDEDSVLKVARVSANNHSEIGDLVFEAYKATNGSGIISVVQTENLSSKCVVNNGMRLKKGWQSPFLVNTPKGTFEAENVNVLCYEGILEGDPMVENWLQEILDLSKKAGETANILIVAENFSEDVLIKLDNLQKRGYFNITAVQAPEYDVKRTAVLRDVAIYTGGESYLRGSGEKIVSGKAKRVVVDNSYTAIIVEDTNEATLKRIEDLKIQMENTPLEENFFLERINNLQGLSATILIGGVLEGERKEKFDRAEDSVGAVKSSLEEGYICGGGAGLLYFSTQMNQKFDHEDVNYGYNLFKKALVEPITQICSNANVEFSNLDFGKLKYGVGYNVTTDRVSNLIDDGILDSTKSIRVAVENAVSVSKMIINTGVVIS